MKTGEVVIDLSKDRSVKEIDQQSEAVISTVYNTVLDRDGKIEKLYSQWNALSKKKSKLRKDFTERTNQIYRHLLLKGIDPEHDDIPEEEAKELSELSREYQSNIEEINLGIDKIKLQLREKGIDPRRFSPNMKTIKFRFRRY